MRGLYIHVPFCGRKCPYCDFYSAGFSNKSADLYLNAVVRNIRHYAEKYGKIHFDTVYCGGGTPSLITADKWQMIFSAAQECFDIAENAEISKHSCAAEKIICHLSAVISDGVPPPQ